MVLACGWRGVLTHHHYEDACIIDRPAWRRWNRHMSAMRLTLHTGLRVSGPGGGLR
jgi:hypothetical protein